MGRAAPSLQGSLAYPETAGGVEWGRGAVDPTTGTGVVLLSREDYAAAVKNGTPQGHHAMAGVPYQVIAFALPR